jgi:CheY-like chemotaxis protein
LVVQPRHRNDVRVLVVDDQPSFLGVAQEVISATPGFRTVACAQSAADALDCLEAGGADLVVMDVRMPGTDGVVAARAVGRLPDPPVVVLCSSDERPDIAADPRAHGAAAFYRKERFGASLLREVWAKHGRLPGAARVA